MLNGDEKYARMRPKSSNFLIGDYKWTPLIVPEKFPSCSIKYKKS